MVTQNLSRPQGESRWTRRRTTMKFSEMVTERAELLLEIEQATGEVINWV